MSDLPDEMLIGGIFWRNHKLRLELEENMASISIRGTRIDGPIRQFKEDHASEMEAVRAAIEDAEVDLALKTMDFKSVLKEAV